MSAMPTQAPVPEIGGVATQGGATGLVSRANRSLKAFKAGPGTYAALTVASVIFMVPLIFVVSISLASDRTINSGAMTILPHEFEWENFVNIFQTSLPVGKFLVNSLIFARLRAPGKKWLFFIVIATMMIPGQITMIPQFYIFTQLGWVNTFLPLIVPQFFSNAYNIFLVRQFVTRIPYEIDEAAQIDGLGYFGIYWRLMLRMMFPIAMALTIFTLTAAWGDFMGPLIYINDESKYPLALGVQYLTSTSQELQTPPWNLIMVGSIFLSVPMILIYYFGQKYMYEMNLSAGSAGVK
jgi:multiple sugar transport system permease protein